MDAQGIISIRYYFTRGFEHEEIAMLVFREHGMRMSVRTLMRRLSILGLRRRNLQYDVDLVRAEIRTLMDGPNSSRGYRAIWHQLQMQGISVPRNLVENLVREIDIHPTHIQQGEHKRTKARHTL